MTQRGEGSIAQKLDAVIKLIDCARYASVAYNSVVKVKVSDVLHPSYHFGFSASSRKMSERIPYLKVAPLGASQ